MYLKTLIFCALFLCLTACRGTDSSVAVNAETAAAQETQIVLAQQGTPEIYAGKRIVEENFHLDLAYRPTFENVVAHSAAIVRAEVNHVDYTSINAQAWTVVHADIREVLSGDLCTGTIDIYAYGGYISMKEIADGERERYADMTDEELENTIVHQGADWQVSPLVGEQYIFFLGAPTDAMPADAYEQLGWKFCQMLVGEDETLYYTPYTEDGPTADRVDSMSMTELKTLISA